MKTYTIKADNSDDAKVIFDMLSDKNRLAIVETLAEGSMNVTALCEVLELPQPTISHHCGLLRIHKLVNAERQGKQVVYSLADDSISVKG